MNNRIIVMDGGNLQFRAIFNFIGQYKSERDKIIKRKHPEIDLKEEIPTNIIAQAENELDLKLRRHEIFIGAPTWTFMNMVTGYYNILKVDIDDLIVLSLDYGSWRKQIDPTYKAQRKEFKLKFKSEEWWQEQYSQFNGLYKKIDESMPIHIIKIYMREADDIMSYASRYYKDKEVVIISSDGDIEMLAYFPNVKIFSPITRKFKVITNPMGILASKIQGDVSDNLLDKPSSEAEFERRKKIVDLIQLPLEIEQPIKEALDKIMPKNLYIEKVPFPSIRKKLAKIYLQENK
jgi:hypothetical protein